MLTFGDISRSVALRLGDMSNAGMRISREQVNRVQREISNRAVWAHLVDEKQFICVVADTTGTVTVTNGSYTVTGSSTAWDLTYVGRKFRLTGSNISYRITSVASTTSLSLEVPYLESNAAAQTYEIFKDEYVLPRDTAGIIKMRQPQVSIVIDPGPTSRIYDLNPLIEAAANPYYYFDAGRTQAAYYNTGTVTMTASSATVSGSGTTFDSTMLDRQFKIVGEQRLYRITTIGGTTSITLSENYRGNAQAGTSYEIDPAGMPIIRLWPRPSAANHVYYLRKRLPRFLTEDDEIPEFPDEFLDVLVAGGYYFVMQVRGADLGAINMAKQDYYDLLKERINKNAISDPNMIVQSSAWGVTTKLSALPGDYPVTRRVN